MQVNDEQTKYHAEYALTANIFDWFECRTKFIRNLKQLHEDTLRAYAILLGYLRSISKIGDDILVFTGNDLLKIIESSIDVLAEQPSATAYLIDIVEIQLLIGKSDDFVEKCERHLVEAVHAHNENAVDVYFRVAARLNAILPHGIPVGMQRAVIDSMHGKWSNEKLFAEALLLIDNVLKKHDANCASLIWRQLCVRRDHECDQCYAILAQFIEYFLQSCRAKVEFAREFLSDKLWAVLRRGMMSSEILRRKQSNYVLRSVLQYVEGRNEYMDAFIVSQREAIVSEHFVGVWETYFIVLDTLLDIQGHLIISSLERYLVDIVKSLPMSWCSVIFAMLFNHSVTAVVQHGIAFALDHKIYFDFDANVNEMLHLAMNNMALYAEESISFVERLAKYITSNNLNHELKMLSMISWKSVPGWIVLNSLAISLKRTPPVHHIDMSALMSFVESFVQTKKHKELPGINETIIDIVHAIGSNRFTLIQLLTLYEETKCAQILDQIAQPLTIDAFEMELIPSTKISAATKVDYFNFALPNAKGQSDFLDRFYERKRGDSLSDYSDCEYILFACMRNEDGLLHALQLFKSRLFDLIPRKDHVTADALLFGVDLMCFIVTRYLNTTVDNIEVYKCIHDTFNSFHEIIRNRMYDGRNATNEAVLGQRVSVICAKLAMCTELHPKRMDVLAILTNAIVIEDYDLDLHRFSHKNAEDCQMVQNLLDWYLYSEAKSAKPVHRAKIIATMLKSFPNLRYDALEVFPMLLAGKCDIKCIFDSTHPSCTDAFDMLLLDAILYGPELKGDERIEYQFIAAISNRPTYVQQVRMVAMQFIRQNNSLKRIRDLKNSILAKSEEFYKVRYFNKSHHHSLKLRYTQALAFLFRLDSVWDDRVLHFILHEANQTNVKYICELIVADTMTPGQLFPAIGKIEGNRGFASMFQIMFYICCKHGDQEFAIKCIDFLMNYMFVKQISVRSAAQITLVKLCDKFRLMGRYQLVYDSIRSSLVINSVPKFAKLSYLSDLRTEYIDCHNLLHFMYVFREIPRLTDMSTDEYFKHAEFFSDLGEKEIASVPLSVNPSMELLDIRDSDITFIEKLDEAALDYGGTRPNNVQKKMIPFRETFIDRQLLNSLPVDFQNDLKSIDSGLIIIASLVSKIPNLGGICRSSEIFGVSAVGIDNLQSIKRSEFTSLSMASEKWLNFIEIKAHYLFSYLTAMKSRGFSIIGAEQTASGKYLNNTTLPQKMVLVLGHEKEGIPANIINLLDLAIEIPQLGVIRSLNVHVTSALFTWEYCKQHLLSSADVSR